VGDLTAAEHHGDLHFVLLFEKPARVPRLRVEIVIVDPGAVLHFLELDHVLLFLRDPRLLRHLELVLAVVHDADDGRTGSCGNFDQVQSLFFGHPKRRVNLENSELRAVGANHANWGDADLSIDPHALCGVLNTEILEEGKQKCADR
jgi:hypothetical protein